MKLVLRLLGFCLVLSFAAAARADDAARALTHVLLAHHEVPPRPVLEAQIPDVKTRLIAVARDERMLPAVRDRAIAALGSWSDPDVASTFAELLARSPENDGRRHRVLLAFATAFPERAVTVVGPYLVHADVELRLTAVSALARVGRPEAQEALTAALAQSEDGRLRRALIRALGERRPSE